MFKISKQADYILVAFCYIMDVSMDVSMNTSWINTLKSQHHFSFFMITEVAWLRGSSPSAKPHIIF